jgi:hypothetical protein
MRLLKERVFWGVLLVVVGGLLMLQALGVLAGAGVIWTVLFGAAGIAFLYIYFQDRAKWWAAIPGFALVGLSAVTAWDELGNGEGKWGGVLLLGSIGVGFLAAYLAAREQWWALIPGGAFLTLALLAGFPARVAGTTTGGVLFLGLAATFGALALVPTPDGRMRWPIIPAAALVLVGALVTLEATTALNLVWPVALILGGVYLIFRAFGPRGGAGRQA